MKTKTIFLLLIGIGISLFTACTKDRLIEASVQISSEETFDLAFGETVYFEDGDFDLIFSQVLEDSRCPNNLRCMRPGQLRLKLIICQADEVKKDIELFWIDGQSVPYEMNYRAYKIILKDISPSPNVTSEIELENYKIRLQII